MKNKLSILILFSIAAVLVSCTKEYITKEYITNEITNVYTSEYYYVYLSEQKEIKTDIRPPYLTAGDSVAIIATSNYVTKEEIAAGKAVLEEWGLKVAEAENLYNKDGRYAGTVNERVIGLQKMIDNPNIKALIAARGGYGCAQIIDKVDLKPLEENPKWVVGFSDVTVLHAAINNRGIETIHGPMANNLTDAVRKEYLKKALFGDYTTLSIPANSNCIAGSAEGRLVGGNLSIIYSLGGTLFDYNMKNAILFIEDTGEANYALDRMLMNLKLSGKLNYIQGVVVGQFTNMTTGSGDKSVAEIIKNTFKKLDIPVMYNIDAGHGRPNYPLYLGRAVKLNVGPDTASITFQ